MNCLKRVEPDLALPRLCRELVINSATFYKWRANYGGMDTSMMARTKEVEEENRLLTCMGCKGSKVQILPFRPVISKG